MDSEKQEKSIYPMSLPGIKSYGIEKWLSEFQPVLSGVEFQNGYEIIFDAYADVVNDQAENSAIYWSGAVNYKASMFMAESYYRYLCLSKLKEQGVSSVFLQAPTDIDLAISEIIKGTFTYQQRYFISKKERFLEALRLIKLNLKSYGLFKALTCLISDFKCCVITDPEIRDVKAFVKENKMSPQCLRPSIFLLTKNYMDAIQDESAPEAVCFVDRFFEIISSKDPRAKAFLNADLRSKMISIFSKTIWNLEFLCNKLKNKTLGTLLVQSVTNPESRVLAAAWKRLGGETIGFCHGNGYLTSYGGSDVNNGTHLVVDRYVVSSSGEKILTDYIRDRMQSKLSRDDEIVALKTPYYKDMFESMRSDPDVKQIKKIMLIGYPMDYHFDPYLVEHNTISYTHLVLRIMKVLKDAGYYLIYKDHPDTLSQTAGFFEEYADEVITTNFNEVYTQADCFFFVTPYSTTFGYSAMSKVPMVYVNNLNFDFWQPDLKLLLDKRAVPFDVSSDADGLLQFSKDGLLNSIENSLHRIDYAVIDKFALGV